MADRPGIFVSTIRAFCVGLFTVIGVAVGLIVLVLLVAAALSPAQGEMQVAGRYKMRPNAQGEITSLRKQSPLVLYLDLSGVIGTKDLNAEKVRQQLERSHEGALRDQRVRAVFVRLNTPGGSVFDSDEIYRLLLDYKERFKVPIFGFAEGLCASGGMYCSAACDAVFASEASLVGSIGVLMNFLNVSHTLDLLGVKSLTLTRGLDKDLMNPLRPWKPEEDEEMQHLIDYYYQLFVQVMLRSRPNLTEQQLVDQIGARIFPAPVAAHLGLIDAVASSEGVVMAELARAAGIEDQGYQVIQLETHTWLDQLLQGESPVVSGKIRHEFIEPLPEGLLYLHQYGLAPMVQ